jgi:hypothetical protein
MLSNNQITGIGRIELALVEISGITDQLHSEVHQRLDFVEDHLRFRVAKAKANPADADALIGTHRMAASEMESAITAASEVRNLFRSPRLIHQPAYCYRGKNVTRKQQSKVTTFVSSWRPSRRPLLFCLWRIPLILPTLLEATLEPIFLKQTTQQIKWRTPLL